MILTYTRNEAHIAAITEAAALKNYEAKCLEQLDPRELANLLDSSSVLVFDLTGAAFSIEAVVGTLDTFDVEVLPPVLYILANPSDIELIADAGSIVNQDYCFTPLEPVGLAARLDVLKRLGDRRKLTMETAITDRLTGLANRKYFLRRLEEELYRTERYKYFSGAIIVDVDFESPGHELTEATGTGVMKSIAEFLKGRLRKTDIIARYKWDSFAFLLPDIDPADSKAVAQDVHDKLELLELEIEGAPVRLKAYLGHLMFPGKKLESMVEVIECLEDCCFQAKMDSGSHVVFFEPDD